MLKINNGQKVLVVILAGGKSRRMMGKDKSLAIINKKKLLDICFKRISQQSEMIIINTNNKSLINFDKKKIFVKDHFSGFLGPLSGVLTGMRWAEKYYPVANWILTVPVDSPFFPDDLLKKFQKNLNDELIVTAKSGDKIHPVFSLWNLSLNKSLELSIKQGILKIDEFTKNFKTKVVNFPIIDYDPFYNINNLEDLSVAEEIHDKYFS